MKEKKLNLLLIALAALALIFAAGCSDGSDDGGSNGGGSSYTRSVSGLTFVYDGDDTTHSNIIGPFFIGPVTLAFDDSGYGVSMAVQFVVCDGGQIDGCRTEGRTDNYIGKGGQSAGLKSDGSALVFDSCVLDEASVSGVTYSYTEATGVDGDDTDTVTVTLPSSESPSNSGGTLVFDVTAESGKITKLTLTSDGTATAYTVMADSGWGCDLFGNYGEIGALVAGITEFAVKE